MDQEEIKALRRILKELAKETEIYNKKRNAGFLKTKKEFYRGKYEAFNRSKLLLERFFNWHEIPLEEEC